MNTQLPHNDKSEQIASINSDESVILPEKTIDTNPSLNSSSQIISSSQTGAILDHETNIGNIQKSLRAVESLDEKEQRQFGHVMHKIPKEQLFGISDDDREINPPDVEVRSLVEEIEPSNETLWAQQVDLNDDKGDYVAITAIILGSISMIAGIYFLFIANPTILGLITGIITVMGGARAIVYAYNRIISFQTPSNKI